MLQNQRQMDPPSLAVRLKSIIQWFPALYACIIVVGFINYYTLFRPFYINIGEYLTVGEMLTAFLPVLIEFIFSSLFVLLIFLLVLPTLRSVGRFGSTRDAGLRIRRLRKIIVYRSRGTTFITSAFFYLSGSFWIVLNRYTMKVIILFLSMYIFLVVGMNPKSLLPMDWFLGIVGLWIILMIQLFVSLVRRGVVKNMYFLPSTIAFMIIAQIMLIAINNIYRAHEVRNHPERQAWQILTATETLQSGGDYIYIGRIEAGVFLFDLKGEIPILIPANEIKRHGFKETLVDTRSPLRRQLENE